MIEEITLLRDQFGARELLVWDDIFGLSRRWVEEFCERVAPFGLTWSVWMRADHVDAGLLRLMRAAGCWNVSYGVESGNQVILDSIRKGTTLQQIRDAFRWTQEAGMESRGAFVLGFPEDTTATIRETVDFAIALDADYAQFQYLTPYPGSDLWEEVSAAGGLEEGAWSSHTIWFPAYDPPHVDRDALRREMKTAYRRFYLRPAYVWKRLLRVRTLRDLHRQLVGAAGVLSLLRGRS